MLGKRNASEIRTNLIAPNLAFGGHLEDRDLTTVSPQSGKGGLQKRDGSCRTAKFLTTAVSSGPHCQVLEFGAVRPVYGLYSAI